MTTRDLAPIVSHLCSELVQGVPGHGGGFVLNSGDVGLLRSLDGLSAADASRSIDEGATVAAHAQHLRHGLALMNRWAMEGGDPFADASWDEAWRTSVVDEATWQEIRSGLRSEALRWLGALGEPREVGDAELTGMIASVVHLGYHLGAIRQIVKATRGPREGTFTGPQA
ncbi:MAG: hypothetical protein AB7O28_05335 [Vicinamibacterales bacterium]